MLKILSAAFAAVSLLCATSANAKTLVYSEVIGDTLGTSPFVYTEPDAGWYELQFEAPGTFNIENVVPFHLITGHIQADQGSFHHGYDYEANLTKPWTYLLTPTGFRVRFYTPGLVMTHGCCVPNILPDGSWGEDLVSFTEYVRHEVLLNFTATFGAENIGQEYRVWLSAVPEPSSWAMMIVGFILTGSAIRRSRGVSLLISR